MQFDFESSRVVPSANLGMSGFAGAAASSVSTRVPVPFGAASARRFPSPSRSVNGPAYQSARPAILPSVFSPMRDVV
jgi:hypothetical protein